MKKYLMLAALVAMGASINAEEESNTKVVEMSVEDVTGLLAASDDVKKDVLRVVEQVAETIGDALAKEEEEVKTTSNNSTDKA